jgi:hypothetical protein
MQICCKFWMAHSSSYKLLTKVLFFLKFCKEFVKAFLSGIYVYVKTKFFNKKNRKLLFLIDTQHFHIFDIAFFNIVQMFKILYNILIYVLSFIFRLSRDLTVVENMEESFLAEF